MLNSLPFKSTEVSLHIMDSDGIRLPPKPAPQLSTALFTSPQLDLTPEKKTIRPTQKIPVVPTENKTDESKEIYAWYVNAIK